MDQIHVFEIGKWIPYSEAGPNSGGLMMDSSYTKIDSRDMLTHLNYAMKCHLENMHKEKEDFDARKDELQKKNEEQAQVTKKLNKKLKKADKKSTAKQTGPKADQTPEQPVAQTSNPVQSKMPSIQSIGSGPDEDKIRMIFNYLNDEELRDRFSMPDHILKAQEPVEVNMSQLMQAVS
jgi:hypothetical protein